MCRLWPSEFDARSRLTSWIMIWVMAAYILQAFIPAGFMPGQNAKTGAYEITICSGAGTKTITVEDDAPSGHAEQDKTPCAYHVASSGHLLHSVGAYIPVFAVLIIREILPISGLPYAQTYQAPSARAPPVFLN